MVDDNYLELNLPKWLIKSIDDYLNTDQLHWDCYYEELLADINQAEATGIISEKQAWYLRQKYLGMEKETENEHY